MSLQNQLQTRTSSLSSSAGTTKKTSDYWAHTLSHVEVGCVLVASESVNSDDDDYKHSVVLITERDEQRCITKGIIINKPISNMNVMTDQSSYNVDLSLKLALANSPVAIGGPVNVDKSEYTILHGQASP